MKIWRAHVDSPNFSFEAYAFEQQGARDCLIDGLSKHAGKPGLPIPGLLMRLLTSS